MMDELTEDAIEEGRKALRQLEQELKERGNDAVSVGSNKHHSVTGGERRLLDQMPRETRLNNRSESLGLTVEELDDRGLLDGGGSVPSYVASMRNKSRRTFELQSRSHRLQGRGKETFTKLLNSFLHMIRTLIRKGLNLEPFCRRYDPNRRGLMRKKSFLYILKTIGLPLTSRELQDIASHYIVPSSADQVDYITFLKDIQVVNLGELTAAMFENDPQLLQSGSLKEIPEGSQLVQEELNLVNNNEINSPTNIGGVQVNVDMDIGMYTLVIADVRRMLLDSIRSLNKDPDEVYRMFARWDTNGTGTVTATQFLRVLARLHVNLSDQDQDFLVELLDTSGMGRIDFEGLLSYCFSQSTPTPEQQPDVPVSPMGMGAGSLSVGEDVLGNDTMSAVSTENNSVDLKSFTSNAHSSGALRRPRTATLSRPYNESNVHTSVHGAALTAQHLYTTGTTTTGPPQSQPLQYHHHDASDEYFRTLQNKVNTRPVQRPMTASARVSSQYQPTTPNSGAGNTRAYPSEDRSGRGSLFRKAQSMVMDFPGAGNRPESRPAGNGTANGANKATSSLPRVVSAGGSGGMQHSQSKNNNYSYPRNTGTAEAEDSQYVVELPDDVMYGEEKYLSSEREQKAPGKSGLASKADNTSNNSSRANPKSQSSQQAGEPSDMQDMASFNDNTLVTGEQEEYLFGTPKSIPKLNSRVSAVNNAVNSASVSANWTMGSSAGQGQGPPVRQDPREAHGRQNRETGRDLAGVPSTRGHAVSWREARGGGGGEYEAGTGGEQHYQQQSSYPSHTEGNNNRNMTHPNLSYESPVPTKEPIEHLVLLANQTLSTLREIITARYRRGKSLQEIFQHFDRDDKSYFDAQDFIIATADLRIETSPRVANIAVNMIALDGYDKVSFGEFKVFVLDSDHKLLELNVQEQLSQMLEQKGREYSSFMIDMFWSEEESLNDSRISATGQAYRQNEYVSKIAFVTSLQHIGLVLTSSEMNRLVDRFDVHGNEMCSVLRFVRMVQNSRAWRHGECVLAYQDEAIEEAEYLRQQLYSGQQRGMQTSLPDLPEELISMCEYLGIRVLSEPNMVWIAADALKAPLPVSWTAQRDASGRTFFFNHLTNQSRLEHPLDPHFRKLRDKYRQGGALEQELDTATASAASMLPPPKNANSNISFGGMGAALNPTPLNHNLVLQGRPQPPLDQFAHLYSHAHNAATNGIAVNSAPSQQQQGYQNASVQPAAAMQDDEAVFIKYSSPNYPQQAGGGGARTSVPVGTIRPGRRPQSALDRPAESQNKAGRGSHLAPSAGGVTTGMYTADLKALMGSAAYSRPLSAPQNHHINVDTIAAYKDATQRLAEKEEKKSSRNSIELLEAVYGSNSHNPAQQRVFTSTTGSAAVGNGGAPPSNMSEAKLDHSNGAWGNTGAAAAGRPASAATKWGARTYSNTTNTNNNNNNNTNNMSAVDRALNIGRTNSGFFNNSRQGSSSRPSRERARSANRATRDSSNNNNSNSSNNLTNTLGRALPVVDKHVRLSEMFSDSLLDQLDTVITGAGGGGRR